jgi:hypothetical protein
MVQMLDGDRIGLTFRRGPGENKEPVVELPTPYQGQVMTLAPGVRGQIRGRVTMMVIMHDTMA